MAEQGSPVEVESSNRSQDAWSAQLGQSERPPTTIHEDLAHCTEDYAGGLSTWESWAFSGDSVLSNTPPWPVGGAPIQYPEALGRESSFAEQPGPDAVWTYPPHIWLQSPCGSGSETHTLDSEAQLGHIYPVEEAMIASQPQSLDSKADSGLLQPDSVTDLYRAYDSSFAMPAPGGGPNIPHWGECPAACPSTAIYGSDPAAVSNRTSFISSGHLSPMTPPHISPLSGSASSNTSGRGRLSPSPRLGMRSAPYSLESPRSKRWSTGSCVPSPSRRWPAQSAHHHCHEGSDTGTQVPLRCSSPPVLLNQIPYLPSNASPFQSSSMMLPTQLPPQTLPPGTHQYSAPPTLLPHNPPRTLGANAYSHALNSWYMDLSEPPDLYSSLRKEQIGPPPEDMNPEDPDSRPHEQELRFDGDLYTPRWVRGLGKKREGWCGFCRPGRWLVLKNSAFWYDKSFTHGISATTGSSFDEPLETRRMDGNPDVWEGLCGGCGEWIALVSSKKTGTSWFRHAYKCHAQPRIKDLSKRARESSRGRISAVGDTPEPPSSDRSHANASTASPRQL